MFYLNITQRCHTGYYLFSLPRRHRSLTGVEQQLLSSSELHPNIFCSWRLGRTFQHVLLLNGPVIRALSWKLIFPSKIISTTHISHVFWGGCGPLAVQPHGTHTHLTYPFSFPTEIHLSLVALRLVLEDYSVLPSHHTSTSTQRWKTRKTVTVAITNHSRITFIKLQTFTW